MHDAVKNLRLKEYNPCGDLTGRERALCDAAAKNFFNLPFVEVMRAVSVKTVAELEREENFPNVDALKHWSAYNLNDTERRASLNFDTFTPIQAGLAKFLVHLLYENRYNIHYNALVNYCRTLDDGKFAIGLTGDRLEQKINSLAQEANYSARVNGLIDELLNFVEGSQSGGVVEGIANFLDAFI